MLSIFKSTSPISDRRVTVPKVEYIQTRMQEVIDPVKEYYRNNARSVKSNHLLVKLIQSVTIPNRLDLGEYLWRVSDLAPDLAKVFGIGSYTQPGQVNPNPTFYGPKCYELLQLRTGYYELGQDWRTVSPLRVKAHPRTDISFVPLDGRQVHDETGLVVIGLDLEALMYMYRGWAETQESLETAKRSIGQFIGSWVLPSMFQSHIDICWFNRLVDRINSYESDDTVTVAGLALPSLTTYVDEAINELYINFIKKNMQFETLLRNIPLLYMDDMYDFTRITPGPRTVSVKVYELLLTKHYLTPLLVIDKIAPGNSNTATYNELRRELLRSSTEKWLSYVNLPMSTTALLREHVA